VKKYERDSLGDPTGVKISDEFLRICGGLYLIKRVKVMDAYFANKIEAPLEDRDPNTTYYVPGIIIEGHWQEEEAQKYFPEYFL
jgi:hypothetical protein